MIQNRPSLVIREELNPGERVQWTGRPRQRVYLRPMDALAIPFSLLWGGFAIFWETSVIMGGAPFFFALWGIPFILVGLYLIIGRFFVDAYYRSRTYYVVTDQRIIILSGLFSQSIKSLRLKSLHEITVHTKNDGSGSIVFGRQHPFAALSSIWGYGMPTRYPIPPTFDGIKDVRSVYRLIKDVQNQR